MIDFSGISAQQTKVLLYRTQQQTNDILDFIFNFHGKQVDYFVKGETYSPKADFVLLKTDNADFASQFAPTIGFIGNDEKPENPNAILSSITGGGIVVYPEFYADWDRAVLQTTNFFRKIPYSAATTTSSNEKVILDTEFGEVEFPISDAQVQKEILGLMHFCQHMGIMEDDFYEALTAYF